jgi:broad specificity phosphatase PhoE
MTAISATIRASSHVPNNNAAASKATAADNNKAGTQQHYLLGIRHAVSTANEFMDQPGRRWGDASFLDDTAYRDAPLSVTGVRQVAALREKLRLTNEQEPSLSLLRLANTTSSSTSIAAAADWLVVVSPLTRCLQTLAGLQEVLPATATTIVLPLCRERVYTSSDTGRSFQTLQHEFLPYSSSSSSNHSRRRSWDWSAVDPEEVWWYNTDNDNNDSEQHEEWRPCDAGQYYAVPGEPAAVFEERMQALQTWLQARPEECILLVTHWGVLRHLGAPNVENCGVVSLDLDQPQGRVNDSL